MKKESRKNNIEIFIIYQKLTKLNRVFIEKFIDKSILENVETKSRDIQIKWNF